MFCVNSEHPKVAGRENENLPAGSSSSEHSTRSNLAGFDVRVVLPQQGLSDTDRAERSQRGDKRVSYSLGPPNELLIDNDARRSCSLGVVSDENPLPFLVLAQDDGVASSDLPTLLREVV